MYGYISKRYQRSIDRPAERHSGTMHDFLARQGPEPGPDGLSYADFSSADIWDLLRDLHTRILNQTYRPGRERTKHLSKGPGRGTRPISFQNIDDRAVQRSIVQILDPILDRRFDSCSLGFRGGRDR